MDANRCIIYFMDYRTSIKQLREKAFLTQVDLAQKLGVSFASVNRYENGHTVPTMKVRAKLHKLFLKYEISEED